MGSRKATSPSSNDPRRFGKDQLIASEIGDLIEREKLSDSSGQIVDLMRILYPNGISPAQLMDAAGVLRALEGLVRIARRKHRRGESPWRRIAAYGVLGAVRDERGFAVTPLTEPESKVRDGGERAQ